MNELKIYDSEGNRYENGQRTNQTSERIKSFFFARARLAVRSTSRPQLICFFRARETSSGRSEQFYAVYQGSDKRSLFRDFRSDLQRKIESEWGMELHTGSSDTYVFDQLTGNQGDAVGSDFDHDVVASLLQKGHRLAYGVPSEDAALSLVKKYLDETTGKWITISERGTAEGVDDHDLVFEPGDYAGLEPLGDTQRHVTTERREQEDRLVDQKISAIQSEVNELERNTSLSSAQIRQRVHRRVPTLKPSANGSGLSSVGGDSDNSPLPGDIEPKTAAIVGGAVLVVALLAIAVVAAGVLTTGSALGVLPFVGDDGGGGAEAPPFTMTVNASDTVVVSGTADSAAVIVNVTDGDETVRSSGSIDVEEDGTYSAEFTDISEGEYTVRLLSVSGSEKNEERTESLSVAARSDGEETTEDESAGSANESEETATGTDESSDETAGNENETDSDGTADNESQPSVEPSIAIEAPTNGTSIPPGQDFAINGTAQGGESVDVTFRKNGVKIRSDESPIEADQFSYHVNDSDVHSGDYVVVVAVSGTDTADAVELTLEAEEE